MFIKNDLLTIPYHEICYNDCSLVISIPFLNSSSPDIIDFMTTKYLVTLAHEQT